MFSFTQIEYLLSLSEKQRNLVISEIVLEAADSADQVLKTHGRDEELNKLKEKLENLGRRSRLPEDADNNLRFRSLMEEEIRLEAIDSEIEFMSHELKALTPKINDLRKYYLKELEKITP
jgi:hypothetical protein